MPHFLRKPRFWFSLLGVTALAALLTVLAIDRTLFKPLDLDGESVVIDVPAGSSVIRLANSLARAGYIDSARLFVLLARWRGVTETIQTGEYRLTPDLTPARLLDKLVAGEQVQYRVTLVEGWTFDQALASLWRAEKLTATLQQASREAIAEAMGLTVASPEGMLFPDTYFYTRGTTDLQLLRRANQRLNEVLAAAWDARLGALPYASPYEALIMASIIEKESAASSERGHIAGVFVRRLEQGMRLQSDPTVIYGLGTDFDGDLRRNDLQASTPYNTYRNSGLPPTPIALAGLDSIRAALNPLPSDYLYFVSKGDGSHHFSSTLDEHNAAVERYQRAPQSQQAQENR